MAGVARAGTVPAVDCYRSGVEAWRLSHPDHSAEYAAKRAVAVIFAARLSLLAER